MAGQRPAEGCARQGALRRVRLRQQRLGGDLSIRAAHDRRAAGGAWRAQPLCPRRGRCPQRSRRPVRKMVRGGSTRGDEGTGRRFQLRPQRRRRAALFDRAGGAVRRQRARCAGRRLADESVGQFRTAEQKRRQSFRPLDPAYRGAIAARHHLSRRRPSQRRAAQRSGAGRFRRAPLRLSARPTRSGCRSPKAAARNCRSAMPSRSGDC